MKNEDLLRRLMKASVAARRDPKGEGEKASSCKRGRGYGHLLDQLSLDRGVCQQELARLLEVRPQSVSEAIASLLDRGLIRKEENGEDRRKALIFLTEEGARHREAMASERRLRANRLFAPLSEDEKQTLAALLQKILDAQREEEK